MSLKGGQRVAQGSAGQRKSDWYDPANGPYSRAKPCNIDLQDNGDMGKPITQYGSRGE